MDLVSKQIVAAQKKWILGGFVLLMAVHIVLVFAGFYGNDDINYARHAANIGLHGRNYHPVTDQFLLRWSTVYSTAFFYKLFGVNDVTSCLCTAMSLAGCGWLLYKVGCATKPMVFLFSATLFFWAHSIIFYSHRLLPDATMCLAVFWMYFSYRNFSERKEKAKFYALQFSIAFLLALITKETIVIALPLFGCFFISDIARKQNGDFWKWSVAFSGLFFLAYILYFRFTTGDLFYRYHILIQNGYFNECSFGELPVSATLKRIGYELWKAMLLNGDLLMMLPAIAAIFYRKKIYPEGAIKKDVVAFLILLLCSNFMTISFTSYVPLCHDPRHFLFLFPFAAVLGGPMLYIYLKEPRKFFFLPVFSAIATIAIFWMQGGTTKYLYALFSILLFSRLALVPFAKNNQWLKMFAASFMVFFSINYWLDIVKPGYPYHEDQKKVIRDVFKNNLRPAIVVTENDFSAEMNEYFLGFKNKNVRFYSIDSFKSGNADNLYLLEDSTHHKEQENKTKDFIYSNQLQYTIVKKSGAFILYRLIKKTGEEKPYAD